MEKKSYFIRVKNQQGFQKVTQNIGEETVQHMICTMCFFSAD